jgi:Domain of unknown function (DUF1707)
MNTVREIRASDLDREQIVARLRGAFEEGRLLAISASVVAGRRATR